MTATAFHNVLGVYENLLQQAPMLAHIGGDAEYESVLEFIETVMEVVGDNPEDPRWGLLEIAAHAVDAYEAQTYPEIEELFEHHQGPTSVMCYGEDESGRRFFKLFKILCEKIVGLRNLDRNSSPGNGEEYWNILRKYLYRWQ